MKWKNDKISNMFALKPIDLAITVGVLALASMICEAMILIDLNESTIPIMCVLSVVVISRLTNGYTCGVIASVIAVFGVNYAFTYPYFKIDFSMSGYPVSFITMLTVSIIVSTMTSRIKLQEKMRIENEKERVRANLMRTVSHDIRTPLTAIAGASSVLLENGEKLTAEQKQDLVRNIGEEANSLIRLVENLMSVTRINDKNAKVKKREEAVEEVVSEAVSRFKKYYPYIEISVKIPNEILFVPMDAVLIEQVIINLLDNAVNHGETTTKINIDIEEHTNKAYFIISDNGIGVNGKNIEELMDSSNASNAEEFADGKRSMGIGLSVCFSIIKAHDGEMTVNKSDDGGAEFVFMLPLGEK